MGKIIIRVQWLIATFVWIYIFYRAVSIGITQDEAYSYFLVKTNYWRAMPGSLNTHWLNTLAMRLFLWLPGTDHVWKLRMLSVLSWWLYSFSTIKLGAEFKNRLVGFIFVLAALLNPFLVFYFSLGRGYAASCAFIFYSIWQASRVIRLQAIKPSDWFKICLPASVAVLANFSSLYFFMGFTSFYVLYLLIKKKASFIFSSSAVRINLMVSGTIVFATASLLFIKYHTRDFDGSETSGFIDSLFSSQIRYGLHFGAVSTSGPAGSILFVTLITFSLISGYQYYHFRKLTIGMYCMCISMMIVLCNAVFYLMFRTPFVFGRTGLMFYVASLPAFFFVADDCLFQWKRLRVVLVSLLLLIGTVFLFNFYESLNADYFSEFPFQADTARELDYLERLNARRVGLSLWHFSVFVNYYSKAFPEKYNFSTHLVDDSVATANGENCDYLIMTTSDSGRQYLSSGWTVLWCNPATNTVVLSKK